MTEFLLNEEITGILFGIGGTLILLLSNISLVQRKEITLDKHFTFVSQLVGYLFLFNSFLYILLSKLGWLKIEFNQYSLVLYMFYILIGCILSYFLVREIDSGKGKLVTFSVTNLPETIIFYLPYFVLAPIFLFTGDYIPALNIIFFFKILSSTLSKDLYS